jgi:HEAT repeat protein
MRWLVGTGIAVLLGVLTIAGSDRLFLRTVPLEQRLVSHDDGIRTKAQQDLLGLASDSKREKIAKLIPSLSAEDPFVRKWAAIAVALTGATAQDTIPALLQCVSDKEKEVAQACRVALAEIGAPDIHQLPILLEHLGDAQPAVRCEAAVAISKMSAGGAGAVEPLMRQLDAATPWPPCLEETTAHLAAVLPEMTPALLPLLQSPTAETRRRAAAVLARLDPKPPQVIQGLLQVLGDDTDGHVRKTAAHAIGLPEAPERGLYPALVAASEDAKNKDVREIAFEELRHAATSAQIPLRVLSGRLRDESATVRLMAVQWLTQRGTGARAASRALLALLKDPDPRVRQGALESLRVIGVPAAQAIAAIAKVQRDMEPEIRCLAVEELVELDAADRVAVPLLIAEMARGVDGAPCATEALSFAGHANNDVMPALITLLQNTDPAVRRRAVYVAMNLGAKARPALPELRKAAQDGIPGAALAVRGLREPHSTSQTRRKNR